jgi:hypothetical protein
MLSLVYPTARTLAAAPLLLLITANLHASPSFTKQTFATGTSIGATGPDSTYVGDGSVWIAYQNGAASTGGSGSSTVVRYSLSGSVQHKWTIAGNVDGLRIDPTTGLVLKPSGGS